MEENRCVLDELSALGPIREVHLGQRSLIVYDSFPKAVTIWLNVKRLIRSEVVKREIKSANK